MSQENHHDDRNFCKQDDQIVYETSWNSVLNMSFRNCNLIQDHFTHELKMIWPSARTIVKKTLDENNNQVCCLAIADIFCENSGLALRRATIETFVAEFVAKRLAEYQVDLADVVPLFA